MDQRKPVGGKTSAGFESASSRRGLRHSRYELGEEGIVAAVERQVVDRLRADGLTDGGGLRLQQGRRRRNLYGLRHLPRDEGHVKLDLFLDVHSEVLAVYALEALFFHRHAVIPNFDWSEYVTAIGGARCRQR